MAEGKIEIAVGTVTFKGEGSEAWLSSELDKMLKHLPELVNIAPPEQTEHREHKKPLASNERGTLAAFLTAKDAKTNQTKRFLATAAWLHDGGKARLSTSDVTKALKDSNQGRLTNASQCLSQNLTAGFCDKDGKQFYVTEDGRTDLG